MKNIFSRSIWILFLGSTLLPAQTFKVAIELPDHNLGLQLLSREVMEIPGSTGFVVVGDVKGSAPGFDNHSFLIRTDSKGDPVLSRSLSNLVPTASDGIRGASVEMDTEGNYYLGGASVQHYTGYGRGSEKTITSLDGSGIHRWTSMAPNWSYEDLHYNAAQRQLFTISGADNLLYPADLLLSRYGTDGRFEGGIGIQTGLEMDAVSLVYDDNGTYYTVATASADISPMIYIGSVDSSLLTNWDGIYDLAGFELVPHDASWNPAGYLQVAGLATETGTGKESGFLMAINTDGSQRYFRTFASNEYDFLTLNGVAAVQSFRDASLNGAIVVGTVKDSGSVASSSVVIAVDSIGDIRWSRGYSDFPPSDLVFSGELSDVIVTSSADEFVASGQYASYVYGNALIHRRITLVRAPISNGFLDDNGNCMNVVTAASTAHSLSITSIGSTYSAGTNTSFNYQIAALTTSRNWCTLEYTGGGITPPSTGGDRYIHPYADQFDQFTLTSVTTDQSIFSITYNNPGRLDDLTYEIMDLHGRTIREERMNPQSDLITVNTAGWAEGLYFLRVIHQGQTIASKTLFPGPFAQ